MFDVKEEQLNNVNVVKIFLTNTHKTFTRILYSATLDFPQMLRT